MSANKTLIDLQMAEKARLSLKAGDQKSARKFALKAIRIQPENEEAWLILAAVSELHQSIEYLNRVLQINPKSKKARKGLHWAAMQLKNSQASENSGVDNGINRNIDDSLFPNILIRRQGFHNGIGHNGIDAIEKNNRNTRWPIPLFITIVLTGLTAFCLLGIPFFEAQAYSENSSRPKNALPKPSLTPTATPTPTPTSSPTPTALPTETPIPAGPADQEYAVFHYHSWDIPDQVSGSDDFWVEVDLTGQILYAYRGDRLINSFLVSTGTNSHPTITGTYKVYAKFPTYTMRGPGYDLPDVPYSMFFYKGYSIHGTYWHNNFGVPMSHGCINMQTNDAAWLYDHVKIGTYVFVHY